MMQNPSLIEAKNAQDTYLNFLENLQVAKAQVQLKQAKRESNEWQQSKQKENNGNAINIF